jgi:hypothetical protein
VRYRDGTNAAANAAPSQDFVTITVVMTFVIGVIFVFVGLRAQQRWLTFWGALTLLACAGYFVYA